MSKVDIENSIIELKKVGTLLRAFSAAEDFSVEDCRIAIETANDLFNQKFEALEAAFYSEK